MRAEAFLDEMFARLRAVFVEQAEGWDVPPAELYRLEGCMAAAVQLGLIKESEMRDHLVGLAEEFLSEDLQAIYRGDQQLRLHLHMVEAPVYRSGGQG